MLPQKAPQSGRPEGVANPRKQLQSGLEPGRRAASVCPCCTEPDPGTGLQPVRAGLA